MISDKVSQILQLKNRSMAEDFAELVETNKKCSETPHTINKQTNKPTSITKTPSLSQDLLAKASSDNLDHSMDHHGNKEVTDLPIETTDSSKSLRKTRNVTCTKTKEVAVTSPGISEDVSGVGASGAAEDAATNAAEDAAEDATEVATEDAAEGIVEEFCFCGGEEYGLMVQCENCSEW